MEVGQLLGNVCGNVGMTATHIVERLLIKPNMILYSVANAPQLQTSLGERSKQLYSISARR